MENSIILYIALYQIAILGFYKWAVLREKVPNGLIRCNTVIP